MSAFFLMSCKKEVQGTTAALKRNDVQLTQDNFPFYLTAILKKWLMINIAFT